MTTIQSRRVKCAICGTESSQTGWSSTNQVGSPDLDTRPPEMARSTMHLWRQRCPECNYVAENLEKVSEVSKEWLCDAEYLSFGEHEPNTTLLETFLLKARLSRHLADWKVAFWDYIYAAWVADDCRDSYWIVEARSVALDMFDNIPVDEVTETWRVVRADLLRKSGQFDRLITEYGNTQLSTEILNQIVAFQIEKAKLQDTQTYQIKNAVSE